MRHVFFSKQQRAGLTFALHAYILLAVKEGISQSVGCVQSANQKGNVHHPEKESETFRTIWGSTTNYHFSVPRIHRQRRIVAPSSHVWCISVGVLSVDAVVGM